MHSVYQITIIGVRLFLFGAVNPLLFKVAQGPSSEEGGDLVLVLIALVYILVRLLDGAHFEVCVCVCAHACVIIA